MSRGIFTNKVSHRKQCLVTVRRQAAPGTTIGELKAGTFALLSRREEYRLFCPGHPAKIGQLLTGFTFSRDVASAGQTGRCVDTFAGLLSSPGSCLSLKYDL